MPARAHHCIIGRNARRRRRSERLRRRRFRGRRTVVSVVVADDDDDVDNDNDDDVADGGRRLRQVETEGGEEAQEGGTPGTARGLRRSRRREEAVLALWQARRPARAVCARRIRSVGEQFCRIVFGRSPTYFVLPSATEERVVRAFPHWRISMRCVPPAIGPGSTFPYLFNFFILWRQ